MKSIGTIYLCGPIQNCTDAECKDWRAKAADAWPGVSLDPMRRDYRGRELENPAQLVADDLEDITNSDALIVWFDRPSVGTSMEIFFAAKILRIPVVVIDARADRTGPLSVWLVYHATQIHTTLEGALGALEALMPKDRSYAY